MHARIRSFREQKFKRDFESTTYDNFVKGTSEISRVQINILIAVYIITFSSNKTLEC